MSELESLKFQITEFMIQTTQRNVRHTFTPCYCFLYHLLMNHSWLGMAKLQRKLSMNISAVAAPWNITMRAYRRRLKHSQRYEELMKPEKSKKCLKMKMKQLKKMV